MIALPCSLFDQILNVKLSDVNKFFIPSINNGYRPIPVSLYGYKNDCSAGLTSLG